MGSQTKPRDEAVARRIVESIDMDRLEKAMNSGAPVTIPRGLTREQKRQFIINNR